MKNIKQTIFFLPSEQFARYESLARTLAEADFGVPPRYRGNFGSCLNAVDIAYRLGVSPLVVLQNTRETDDGLTWGYQFVRVLIEASGQITGQLDYEVEGQSATDSYRVRAIATRTDGQRLNGTWVTWQMATLEKWTENISYTSMPEVMFRARATTFFGNQYFPGLLLGMSVDTEPLHAAPAALSSAPAPGLVAMVELPAGQGDGAQAAADSPFAQALALTPTAQAPAAPQGVATAPATAPASSSTAEGAAAKTTKRVKTGRAGEAPTTEQAGTAAPAATPGPQEAHASPPAQDLLAPPGAQVQGASSVDVPLDLPAAQPSKPTQQELNERFSRAFAAVDATRRTKESLTESMALIETFTEVTEKSDLYLILLNVVEKHLVSMANGSTAPTRAEIEFATESRLLHQAVKVYAESCEGLADKRKAMGTAYNNLGGKLAAKKAQQAS